MIVSAKNVQLLKRTARNLIREYWKATTAEQLDVVGFRMDRLCGWLSETLEDPRASAEVIGKCTELLGWIDGHIQNKE